MKTLRRAQTQAIAARTGAGEAAAVSAKLAELGGVPETHEVTKEALDQASTAADVNVLMSGRGLWLVEPGDMARGIFRLTVQAVS